MPYVVDSHQQDRYIIINPLSNGATFLDDYEDPTWGPPDDNLDDWDGDPEYRWIHEVYGPSRRLRETEESSRRAGRAVAAVGSRLARSIPA